MYEYGRIGEREITVPQLSPFLKTNDDISAGLRHVAVLRNGVVYSTAMNEQQKKKATKDSNNNNNNNNSNKRNEEEYKELARDVVAMCSGGEHVVMLKKDGTVWGQGCNRDGQLGLGKDESTVLVPTQIPRLKNVVRIACGGDYTIATIKTASDKPDPAKDCSDVASNAELVNVGFGWNGMQQLLDDAARKELRVPTALPYRGVPCPSKYSHTMYIDNGNLYGVGGFFKTSTAELRFENVDAASGGLNHAVLVANGKVFATGENTFGQVGVDEK